MSKSKNTRRDFEASSIIKSDKDKGNKFVIWIDWKKCSSFGAFRKLKNENLIPGGFISAVFCKSCEILPAWNCNLTFGHSFIFKKQKWLTGAIESCMPK